MKKATNIQTNNIKAPWSSMVEMYSSAEIFPSSGKSTDSSTKISTSHYQLIVLVVDLELLSSICEIIGDKSGNGIKASKIVQVERVFFKR